ncbi:unnamed protein product [Rhodiola kirilowii]
MSILPSDLIAPFLPFQTTTDEAAIDWNWKETPEAHIFKFHLPGYSKSDVKINIYPDARVLQITTVEKIEDEIKGETWHCRERPKCGRFSKRFRVPENAKIDGISASMKDGVLVVTVPKDQFDESGKMETVKKRSVEIEGKDDHHRHGGGNRKGGGVLGSCFVCFKP